MYADIGELEKAVPEVQVAGSAARRVVEHMTDLVPAPTSRKATAPAEPVGLRIAIQYRVPEVMLAAGRATVLRWK